MALTTPNMGLISWDQASDPYDHNQLAANFNTLDAHDHTPGEGPRITRTAIQDAAINTAKVDNLAITTGKIANNAVTAQKMDRQYVHPIGSIMPWWRPSGATAIPDGWLVASGQVVSAGQHDFPGGGAVTLPDLRNRFLLGATTDGSGISATDSPAVGYAGGSHTIDISHSHTVPSHTHTVEGHSHTANAHTHTVQSHSHSLSDHRHVHFFPVAAQVPQSGSDDWQRRIMNPVDLESFEAINPVNGGTILGTYPDAYYSPTLDTYTQYAGAGYRTTQSTYSMVSIMSLPATTANRIYDRFLTFSSPPVNGVGKRVTLTGGTGGETLSSSPGTNLVELTSNPTSLTTNPSGGSIDARPKFVGVLYLIKVRNTV